jgi:hypothetical protein
MDSRRTRKERKQKEKNESSSSSSDGEAEEVKFGKEVDPFKEQAKAEASTRG